MSKFKLPKNAVEMELKTPGTIAIIGPPMNVPDLEFVNHGSIVILYGKTDAGRTWMEEHLPVENAWIKNTIAIEPRYVDDIANGAMQDGLIVK